MVLHQNKTHAVSSFSQSTPSSVHLHLPTASSKAIFAIAFLLPLCCCAVVPCNMTLDCEIIFLVGSTCVDNKCTNPFASGCLRTLELQKNRNGTLGSQSLPPRRICNSDDNETGKLCSISQFDYPEIRIANQNWESPMFLSWIMQIYLSERLEVPSTIETGFDDKGFSFYDIDNSFTYAKKAYDFASLEEANRLGDCRNSSKGKSCAHVMPEAWNGYEKAWLKGEEAGYIEAAEGNGMVTKISVYIPKFTALNDSSLTSYYGLKGETNRVKLAQTFKRPTNWIDYCEQVSSNNCTENDGIARTYPSTLDEQSSYFVSGKYIGHFRNTEKNDCVANPLNCSGHIIDAPCEWSTYIESKMHWNNISLESDGPLEPNSSYSYSHMVQIWRAANATRSDVIIWWWRPDATSQEFANTLGEFQPVQLPMPSSQCSLARITDEERCSADLKVRRGKPGGSCDNEAQPVQKLIAASLYSLTYDVPEANRSPGYDFVKRLRISDLAMETLFRSWLIIGKDRYGYDARAAVCQWVYDNMDELERYIPKGYPRVMQEDDLYSIGMLSVAGWVGGCSLSLVVLTAAIVYRERDKEILVYAQVHFLFWILSGLLLVSIGAILFVLEPTLASCMSQKLVVTMGYTLIFVPLIVKVAAINKVIQMSQRARRVSVNQTHLHSVVVLVATSVLLYLIAWTVIDPSKKREDRVLLSEGSDVVIVRLSCSSSLQIWTTIAFVWEGLLLICALVLSFQSRNIKQEFNESQGLAVMVYSHFLFMVMRGVAYFLPSTVIPSNIRAGTTSFLISFDVIFSLIIYFLPKFLHLFVNSKTGRKGRVAVSGMYQAISRRNFGNTTSSRRNVGNRVEKQVARPHYLQ